MLGALYVHLVLFIPLNNEALGLKLRNERSDSVT